MRGFRGRRPPARTEEILPLPLAGPEAIYVLKRSSARRTLALRVSDQGAITVNAPMRLPGAEVERFLARHAEWLLGRLDMIRARTFHWRDGVELPWLGGCLRLSLQASVGRPSLHRDGDSLVCAAEADAVPVLVKRWYLGQARVRLAECLAAECARIGRAVPPFKLSDARTRWGSLSPGGVLRLNWRLVKASREERAYVVCHELAHFRRRDHSPAFWREVAALFPDYERVRTLLRRRGPGYFEF